MRYNKKRHLELLKSSSQSDIPKEILSNEDFLKCLESKPDENFFELQKYSCMMISHLHQENREHYFELIEKWLNDLIAFSELRKKHQVINNAVEQLEADLILL